MPSTITRATKSNSDTNSEKMSAEIEKIVKAVNEKIESLRNVFMDLIKKKDEEIGDLKSRVSTLEKQVESLRENLDDSEAYERRDTLIISGSSIPAVRTGENTTNICSEILKDKLRVTVHPNDISTSHRIGRKPVAQIPDKRSIILKLCRRDVKYSLLQACKQQKPENLFLNESLTPIRSKIMFALRKMKRIENSRVTGCGSREGKVFAWIKHAPGSSPGSRDIKVPVNTFSALKEFTRKYMNEDASKFVDINSN